MTGRGRRLIGLVDLYQQALEGRPSPCRFTPTCSSYAREALDLHGAGRGLWLTVRRLLRCRPFGPSGFDPVPPAGAVRRPADASMVVVSAVGVASGVAYASRRADRSPAAGPDSAVPGWASPDRASADDASPDDKGSMLP